MLIGAHTKIAAILRQDSNALEAIVSLHPAFEKLRNPFLRKLMAARTSVGTAAAIAGVPLEAFLSKLHSIGFDIESSPPLENEDPARPPAFLNGIQKDALSTLDVRPVLASGADPLTAITRTIKTMKPGEILRIINSFYPEPLIQLLTSQGYESWCETIHTTQVDCYFRKPLIEKESAPAQEDNNFDEMLLKYQHQLLRIDVRNLPMPQPMITILETLNSLPEGSALLVLHKRIPVFLLPELRTRNFEFRTRQMDDGSIQLIIFKDVQPQ